MHPRPSAETSGPFLPSRRVCMGLVLLAVRLCEYGKAERRMTAGAVRTERASRGAPLPNGFEVRVVLKAAVPGDQRHAEDESRGNDDAIGRIVVQRAGKIKGAQEDLVVDRNEMQEWERNGPRDPLVRADGESQASFLDQHADLPAADRRQVDP